MPPDQQTGTTVQAKGLSGNPLAKDFVRYQKLLDELDTAPDPKEHAAKIRRFNVTILHRVDKVASWDILKSVLFHDLNAQGIKSIPAEISRTLEVKKTTWLRAVSSFESRRRTTQTVDDRQLSAREKTLIKDLDREASLLVVLYETKDLLRSDFAGIKIEAGELAYSAYKELTAKKAALAHKENGGKGVREIIDRLRQDFNGLIRNTRSSPNK